MSDIRDELDASVEFGSGFICVVGPPCCGKSTLVLDYLVRREEAFNQTRSAGCVDPQGEGELQREFTMEYMTAHSVPTTTLSEIIHRVRVATASALTTSPAHRKRRLMTSEASPLELGAAVAQWVTSHSPGSELHLVLDDADAMEEDADRVNMWPRGFMQLPELSGGAAGTTVCLWLVSQVPIRLPDCYRFHLIAPPRAEQLCAWLHAQFRQFGEILLEEAEGVERLPNTMEAVLTPSETHKCVVQAVEYYVTHQPMCSSVVCKDVRQLLQRVYRLLPALIDIGKLTLLCNHDGAEGVKGIGGVGGELRCTLALNAIDLSRAWGRQQELGGRKQGPQQQPQTVLDGEAADVADPLVHALQRIGFSAVLLAFAAFYCGAVPRSKQYQVFGAEDGQLKRKSEAKAQSHKAAVLTASAHLISVPRLMFIYQALLRMCVEHIDPVEFAPPQVAVQHVHGFVSWGLLTPALSKVSKAYHCWIPVSTAVHLGRVLSVNLYDLIPM